MPVPDLRRALDEIDRILRPGGYAYVSEPVFTGEFNDIIRLFHDEESVRQAAFEAMVAAVDSGQFDLVNEVFFLSTTRFKDFADFERRLIRATHTEHRLSADTHAEVERRFAQCNSSSGGVRFEVPMRVDLLRKRGQQGPPASVGRER